MLEAYIDGACEPKNPGGTASWGVIVYRSHPEEMFTTGADKEEVWEGWGIVGSGPKMSNNVGEYAALVELLKRLSNTTSQLIHHFSSTEDVLVLSDSQLVVNQMSNEWTAKSDKLYYPYYYQALNLMLTDNFARRVKYQWIPREQNSADVLTVKALSQVGIVRRR